MNTQITAIKRNNRVSAETKVDTQILKTGFAVLAVSTLAIGIWSFASLLGGIVAAGGPLNLLASWFSAVIG